MSTDQFVRNLIASGLLSAPEIHDYLGTFPPEKKPRDGEALAREMVRDERLTKYQAARVLAGEFEGLVFGEYVILSKIGEGGMGQVFKARHRQMDRLAAIKLLTAESLESSDLIKRFHQEVHVAAKLNHPNIVTTYDAGEQNGFHFLIMEYVEGRDLASIVKAQGPLPLAQAFDCVLQAARGLEYAHGLGVIHRDIKPGNLLLATDGSIKILDMGLARIAEPDEELPEDATVLERLTQRGQMLGTVDYMSPEQASCTRNADQRSDIYSLGCTLYRLITARPIYDGNTAIAKLMSHYEADIPKLSEAQKDVSPHLERVFRQMVAKLPEDRFQSMTEVIAALESSKQIEESLVQDTVTLVPTDVRAKIPSNPEEATVAYPQPAPDDGELTLKQSVTAVATTEESAAPTVRDQSSQKTLSQPPHGGVQAAVKAARAPQAVANERAVSTASSESSGEAQAGPGAAKPASLSSPLVLLLVAVAGGLVGALAVAALLLALLS
jgi:serine/threonine protein kinase